MLFPIESTRTLEDSCSLPRLESTLRIIQGIIIPLQPIYFIEEKALDIIRHQTIDIFKDEETEIYFPCFLEYRANVALITELS